MNLLHTGDQIINLDHLVRAVYESPIPGGEQAIDDDTGQTYTTLPRKAVLKLILTALEVHEVAEDLPSAYHLAAASRSVTVRLTGQKAEDTWRWLQEFAQPANIIPA